MLDQDELEAKEARARSGSADAFGQLLRSFDDDVRRRIADRITSQQAVNDVLRSGYGQAFRTIRTVDEGSTLEEWVQSACAQRASEYLEAESDTEDEPSPPVAAGAFSRMVAAEPHETAIDSPPGDLTEFWSDVDADLAKIEAGDDFDGPSATDVDTDDSGNGFRPLAIAAAIIGLLVLGALLLNMCSDDATDGNIAVDTDASVVAEAESDTGTPVTSPGDVGGPEGPLEAVRSRIAGQIPGAGADVATVGGPFCFQADAAAMLADVEAPVQRTIAWLEVAVDGQLTMYAYQPGEAATIINATAPGEVDGTVDVRFTIAAGAVSDLPIYSTTLTDNSFTLYGTNTLALVDCALIDGEVTGLFDVLNQPVVEPDIDGPVVILPSEDPIIWRFTTGPVNYRVTPGLGTEIIDQWAGDEIGVRGTGGRAIGTGYRWVELAAADGRPSGWVAQDFIEPDPTFSGRLCYRTDQTAMVLDFSDDAETFVGGLRTNGEAAVEYFGLSGRRSEGTLFAARVQNAETGGIGEQQWSAFRDGMSTDLGLLEITDCAAMSDAVTEIDANIASYPALPA